MPSVKDRVDSLEKTLEEYIRNVGNAQMQTEKELREFKDEMRAFKEEMSEDRKKAFRQWGEVTNKMGTLAEDFVAPCVREVAERYFGCSDEEDFMVRRYKRKPKEKGKRREFDIIAVYEKLVVLVEVKSTPRLSYIDEFVAILKELPEYFPEYGGRRVVPVFASQYLPDDVVAYLTKNGIYAMAIRDDMMDLMNYDDLPRMDTAKHG